MICSAYFIALAVIVYYIAEIDCLHHAVGFGIHIGAVDGGTVESDGVKGILVGKGFSCFAHNAAPDDIVLIFQRAVDAIAVFIIGDAPQVPRQIFDAPDQFAVKIGFDEHGGKGVIYVSTRGV